MQHLAAVAECDALQDLFDDTADCGLRQFLVFGLQVLLEVVVVVIENNLEALLLRLVLDIEQPSITSTVRHNVGVVLERLK